jgi:hypothetical protein
MSTWNPTTPSPLSPGRGQIQIGRGQDDDKPPPPDGNPPDTAARQAVGKAAKRASEKAKKREPGGSPNGGKGPAESSSKKLTKRSRVKEVEQSPEKQAKRALDKDLESVGLHIPSGKDSKAANAPLSDRSIRFQEKANSVDGGPRQKRRASANNPDLKAVGRQHSSPALPRSQRAVGPSSAAAPSPVISNAPTSLFATTTTSTTTATITTTTDIANDSSGGRLVQQDKRSTMLRQSSATRLPSSTKGGRAQLFVSKAVAKKKGDAMTTTPRKQPGSAQGTGLAASIVLPAKADFGPEPMLDQGTANWLMENKGFKNAASRKNGQLAPELKNCWKAFAHFSENRYCAGDTHLGKLAVLLSQDDIAWDNEALRSLEAVLAGELGDDVNISGATKKLVPDALQAVRNILANKYGDGDQEKEKGDQRKVVGFLKAASVDLGQIMMDQWFDFANAVQQGRYRGN